MLRLTLRPARARALFLTCIAASIAAIAGTAAAGLWWRRTDLAEPLRWLLHQLDLGQEGTLATWWSALLLLAAALGFGLCFLADRVRRPGERWIRLGWLALAALFAGLSLDEVGSLHERLGDLRALDPLGVGGHGWVRVFLLPFAGFAMLLAGFAWVRLRRHPATALLLLLGVLAYASVFRLEDREVAERVVSAGTPRPWSESASEEGAELAGSLAFLGAALVYLCSRRPRRASEAAAQGDSLELALTTSELRRLGWWGIGLVAAGLLVLGIGLVHLVPGRPSQGNPIPWFAAVAALAAGLLVRHTAASPGDRVLALWCLLLSADQGSLRLITGQLWDGSPRAHLALSAALALTTLAVGAGAAASAARAERRAVLAWTLLAALGVAAADPALAAALLVAAHAALVPVAVGRLEARAPAQGVASD